MRSTLAIFLLLHLATACGSAAELTLTLQDAAGKSVADAVVSLHPLDATAPAPTEPLSPVSITQLNGEFTPLVTAVRTGTRIDFPNRDKVQHQVYSLSAAKRFEIPLHGSEHTSSELFDQPGLVAIGCNIHDWMRAYVIVLDTPWFAVSTANTAATLTVPAGRYRLEIWHHRLAELQTRELTLSEATPLVEAATLPLRRDRRPPRPLNATTPGGYR